MNDFENKRSETERILERALNDIGLYPIPQYQISKMHVDFAFPEERLVVEVDGIHHDDVEQNETDTKRDDYLRGTGWTVLRLHAHGTYNNPERAALLVKERLESGIEKSYTCPKSHYEPYISESHSKHKYSFWKFLEKTAIASSILLGICIYTILGSFGLERSIFAYLFVLLIISFSTRGYLGLRRTMTISFFITLLVLSGSSIFSLTSLLER